MRETRSTCCYCGVGCGVMIAAEGGATASVCGGCAIGKGRGVKP